MACVSSFPTAEWMAVKRSASAPVHQFVAVVWHGYFHIIQMPLVREDDMRFRLAHPVIE